MQYTQFSSVNRVKSRGINLKQQLASQVCFQINVTEVKGVVSVLSNAFPL